MTLGSREDKFWQLVSEGRRAYVDEYRGLISWFSSGKCRCTSDSPLQEKCRAFVKASHDWPSLDGFLDRAMDQYTVSFTVAGLFYGGLHAIAWNAPFASDTQQLLWRMCSIALGTSGPVTITIAILSCAHERDGWFSDVVEMRVLGIRMLLYLIFALVVVWALFYLFIRAFIVVESFLSLSHMPKAVYMCMEWSNYFPNLS